MSNEDIKTQVEEILKDLVDDTRGKHFLDVPVATTQILSLINEARIDEWERVNKDTFDKPITPENKKDHTWQGGYRFAKNSFKRFQLARISDLKREGGLK